LFAKTRELARASLLVLPRTETALERVRHCIFRDSQLTANYADLVLKAESPCGARFVELLPGTTSAAVCMHQP
jgi:hypothetical protein